MVDALNSGAAPARADVVLVESAQRPTPRPARVAFSDVLAAGASGLAQGAQVAVSALPGSAVTAAAVRGGGSGGVSSPLNIAAPVTQSSAEGPGGASSSLGAIGGAGSTTGGGISIGGVNVGGSGTTDTSTGSVEQSLQQSASLNLYYLQLQEQEDAQNRAFTAQSNILKTEHDGAKNAIGNIHS
jgi:hypothetical protein